MPWDLHPGSLLTHSKVLSSIRDLLILDKGKAFSGIINSSSWISSLGSCSSTLKSSSLSFVSSTGLHSEQPSVSFMSEMLVPPKTFIVIKGRREGGSRCKLGNNCYCYRWSSGARRYVDGIFQNERKRQQHWQQRILGAPFNCDRWFVQSLKKGKYICAIPWFEIWRKHIFSPWGSSTPGTYCQIFAFQLHLFFSCLAIIYYVEITVTLWGILPTAGIVFFCRTYSISLLSGLQRRYCNMSPQHHKPHCFK